VKRRFSPVAAACVALVLLYVAGLLAYPRFGSPRVLAALCGDNGFLGIAAVGAVFAILTGGVDLAVGAVAACASVITARALAAGASPVVATALALAGGLLFGLFQGAAIGVWRLPAFLVTLAGMFLARGLAFFLHERSLPIRHEFFVRDLPERFTPALGGGATLAPAATAFFAVALVAAFVLRRTSFGRDLYAVGDDEAAAAALGVPVARTRVAAYGISGLCGAAAGVVYAAYTQSGDPAACRGLELDAIAAAVVGGASLSGGAGGAGGAVLGTLALGLVQTHVVFHGGLNSWWTRIFVGGLLLAFVAAGKIAARGARESDS
jgi:simple sugar transport system permease protein